MATLTKARKEEIIEALVEYTFGAREKRLEERHQEIAIRIYNERYDAETRALILRLKAKYDNAFVDKIGKTRVSVSTETDSRRQVEFVFPADLYAPIKHAQAYTFPHIVEYGTALHVTIKSYQDDEKELAAEKRLFEKEAGAVINQATTYNKLKATWPELATMLPADLLNPPPKEMLPAVNIESLNSKIKRELADVVGS